jgi:5-deoxy-glucuronate isomerase
MSRLLVKPEAGAQVHEITPASANWDYVGFEVFDLAAGESINLQREGHELCLVVLTGTGVALRQRPGP